MTVYTLWYDFLENNKFINLLYYFQKRIGQKRYLFNINTFSVVHSMTRYID